jgi:putative transposase
MKKLKLSESQIITMIQEGESGIKVEEICRKYGIAQSTYHKLKSKYSGMQASDLKRLKELEEENRKLKHMYANLSLEHMILKDVIEKKL